MRLHPGSLLLGLGLAAFVPLMTRTFRPWTVKIAAGVLDALDEARRTVAEQLETIEDLAAEARAVRESQEHAATDSRKPRKRTSRNGDAAATHDSSVTHRRPA